MSIVRNAVIRLETVNRPNETKPASPLVRAGCGPLTFPVPAAVSVRASLATGPQTVPNAPDSPIEVPGRCR
jgi:hypothetical protein